MAFKTKANRTGIVEAGKKNLYGVYPKGVGPILDGKFSDKSPTTVALKVGFASGSERITGDTGEFKGNFVDALDANDTLNVKGFQYSCTDGQPELVAIQ